MNDRINAPAPGYKGAMIPIDESRSLSELVQMALFNIDQWEKIALDPVKDEEGKTLPAKTHKENFLHGMAVIAARQGWDEKGTADVRAMMMSHPPNRLYRVRGNYASSTRGISPLGVVGAYRPVRGGTAEAAIIVLGAIKGEPGSATQPIPVPADGLEDVTDAARTGSLSELSN